MQLLIAAAQSPRKENQEREEKQALSGEESVERISAAVSFCWMSRIFCGSRVRSFTE